MQHCSDETRYARKAASESPILIVVPSATDTSSTVGNAVFIEVCREIPVSYS